MQFGKLCKCGRDYVEVINGWDSGQCGRCSDREYEREQRNREFMYFHSGNGSVRATTEEDKS